MAVLTGAEFVAKYNGIFADNITREISEQDLRDLVVDIKDSFFNSTDFVAPAASFASITGNATDNASIVALANDIINTIRGGVDPAYNTLKKLYDFIVAQIGSITDVPIVDGGAPAESITTIKIRGGLYNQWTTHNPILVNREIALVSDYKILLFGDGVKDFDTLWSEYEATGTGGGSKYFPSESDLIAALPPGAPERQPGDWALVQGVSAVTVWTWNPTTSLWEDTGNEVVIVVDTVLSPTSGNAIANSTVTLKFEEYLPLDGTIEIPQVNGLPAALDAKIDPSELYGLLSPLLQQGTGIQIVKNGTDFVFKLLGGLPPGGDVGGDLDGTLPDPIVVGIQGKPVTPTAPTEGALMKFTGGTWSYIYSIDDI